MQNIDELLQRFTNCECGTLKHYSVTHNSVVRHAIEAIGDRRQVTLRNVTKSFSSGNNFIA